MDKRSIVRRFGSNCWTALVLLAGFVLLTASPAATVPRGGMSSDVLANTGIGHARRYLPNEPVLIACVHLDLLLATKTYQELEKVTPFVKEIFTPNHELIGLSGTNVTTVVMGGRPEQGLPITVISTRKPVVLEDQLRQAYPEQIFHAEAVGQQTILVPDGDTQDWIRCYHQADSHTLVCGSRTMLQQVLARQRDCHGSPTLEAALLDANFSQHVTMIIDMKTLGERERAELRTAVPIDKKLAESIDSLTLNIDFSTGVAVHGRAICKQTQQAKDLKRACNLLLGLGKQSGAIPKPYHAPLKQLKLSHEGRCAHARWSVDTPTLMQYVKLFTGGS